MGRGQKETIVVRFVSLIQLTDHWWGFSLLSDLYNEGNRESFPTSFDKSLYLFEQTAIPPSFNNISAAHYTMKINSVTSTLVTFAMVSSAAAKWARFRSGKSFISCSISPT